MYKYLHDRKYYVDRYDLSTINECLQTDQIFNNLHQSTVIKDSKLSAVEKVGGVLMISKLALHFKTGEFYKNKDETIKKWMEEDDRKDDILSHAPTPTLVCPICLTNMIEIDRSLYDYKSKRILFLLECSICHFRKGIYSDGQEFKNETPCPNCGRNLDTFYKRKGNIITTIKKCSKCRYKNMNDMDLQADTKNWEEKQRNEQALLAKYRSTYCLNEKDGSEYLESLAGMERISKLEADIKERNENPAYQKVTQLQRLSITELEKLLNRKLPKYQYIKLLFKEPVIDRFVQVPFTIKDSDTSRKEYDSVHKLQKLLKSILELTNWRLMSDGVRYRLGFLSGQLKGYEHEADLVKLFTNNKQPVV
jgi:hypothetical protein